MKALKLTLIALTFLILPSTFAHAASFFSSYADIYTTGAQNSTVAQTTFSWSEKPWLYIKFYDTPALAIPNKEMTFTSWSGPMLPLPSFMVTYSNNNQVWISFSDSYWNSIKTTGFWGIGANSLVSIDDNLKTPFVGGQANFKVNAAPEPTTVLLFLTGAFIMGFFLYRRRAFAA